MSMLFWSGAAVTTLALSVVLGWIVRVQWLVQVVPGATPFQFNLAVGLGAVGGALIAQSFGRRRIAIGLGASVACLGLIVLLQYGFEVLKFLDQWWGVATFTDHTVYPGRMAPNAAVSLIFAGLSLVLSAMRSEGPIFRWASGILAMVVVCIAFIEGCGYVFEGYPPSFAWGSYARMAIHSSFLFFLVGLVLVIQGMAGSIRNSWPYLLGLFVVGFGFLLWKGLINVHARELFDTMDRMVVHLQRNWTERSDEADLDRLMVDRSMNVRIYRNDQLRAVRHVAPSGVDAAWKVRSIYQSGNTNWRIEIEPTIHSLRERKQFLPFLVLIGAIQAALLISILLHFVLLNRDRVQEIKKTSYFLKRILDSVDYAVMSTDIHGVIQTWNRKAEEMLGYRAEEVVGKHTPDLIHLKEEMVGRAEELSRELKSIVQPGFEVFTVIPSMDLADEREWTYVHKDGRRFPVRLRITAVGDGNGEIVGFVGLALDIGAEKSLKDQLYDQQLRMSEVSRRSALIDLSSAIAHEVNNPLEMIRSQVRGAMDQIKKGDFNREGLEASCSKVMSTVDRISEIIQGLLKFTGEAQRGVYERVTFASLVKTPLDLCSEKIRSVGAEIRVLAREDAWVECRAAQISEAIFILLLNACEAVKGRSERWIEIQTIQVGDEFLEVTVRDSGAGIPPEVAYRIFDPFFTPKDPGLEIGMDLSIAKGIVENQNGALFWSSGVGATEFTLRIPLRQGGSAAV